MGAVTRDASPAPTLADRLSGHAAALDDPVNAAHDDLNRRVPWLWWPLTAPGPDERMDGPRHALYAAHAGLGIAFAAALAGRRGRSAALVGGVALAAVSWALFTGAWDRRADRLADADWDAYDADGPEA
jgi:hypothetical protein